MPLSSEFGTKDSTDQNLVLALRSNFQLVAILLGSGANPVQGYLADKKPPPP